MNTFREQIKEDLNIFFDDDAYAEKHSVEGVDTDVVIDNDYLNELKAGAENALAEAELLFYAKTEKLPPKRGYGRNLIFDGEDWFVISWKNDKGLSEIILKRNCQ